MPGYLPFRGDGHPNIPGKRRPPNAEEKEAIRSFGYLALIVGIVLVYFISTTKTGFIGFAAIAGLIFVIMSFFALRDAFGIEANKPDDVKIDDSDPTMFKDYITQVEWTNTHRKRHHPSHWSAPEPEWRFLALRFTSDKVVRDFLKRNSRLVWLGIFSAIFILAGIAVIFGVSFPITIIMVSITCLVFLAFHLIRD